MQLLKNVWKCIFHNNSSSFWHFSKVVHLQEKTQRAKALYLISPSTLVTVTGIVIFIAVNIIIITTITTTFSSLLFKDF
jgi:hypothetical protein